MNTNRGTLRYRITGLLLLLAFAVILGPLVFDGDGLPRPADIEPMAVPSDAALLNLEEVRVREQELRPAALPPAPVIDDLQALEAEAATLRGALDEEQFATSGPATAGQLRERPGEPGLRPVADDTRMFAVQVASFAEQINAEALQQELRSAGFEAFLSAAVIGERRLTRVAVGPYLNRRQADTDRAAISDRFQLDAKVVAMLI